MGLNEYIQVLERKEKEEKKRERKKGENIRVE